MADRDRLRRALSAIDAANAGDPHRICVRGSLRSKELAHAELASEWVGRLCPEASEPLLLAARAHHVRRWEIERERYPEGQAGYHRWRKALQGHHAHVVAEILAAEGYDEATIARVQEIVRKKDLGRDAEVQALEDALCLVFLETQFRDLSQRLEREKILDITRKTLRKMSPRAIELAVRLPLDPEDLDCIERAASD